MNLILVISYLVISRHVHREDEIVLTKLDSNAIFITYILFFSLV